MTGVNVTAETVFNIQLLKLQIRVMYPYLIIQYVLLKC